MLDQKGARQGDAQAHILKLRSKNSDIIPSSAVQIEDGPISCRALASTQAH